MIDVTHEDHLLTIDARNMIRQGHHPRQEIVSLIKDAPSGTVCEVHVPHRTGPLISALEDLGMNVAVAQLEPGHFRLRVLKF